MPAFWGGIFISVTPVGVKFVLYPILGIRRAKEQSKVPWVLTFKITGMSALATVIAGLYPPLAVISTICAPSIILELTAALSPGLLFAKNTAPIIKAEAIMIEKIVNFIINIATSDVLKSKCINIWDVGSRTC